MRPIKVTIDVDPQKIPDMVCCDYSLRPNDGTEQIAIAVAKALGLEDYLYQPERIYELRRWMWEQGNKRILLVACGRFNSSYGSDGRLSSAKRL